VTTFGFIAARRTEHSIALMCRVLEVSRSGYHAWMLRPLSPRGVEGRLVVDEPEGLHGRSVSLAKYTAAFCKICFSSSSLATLRRSATISAFSSRV
jgi:hypothetical protein